MKILFYHPTSKSDGYPEPPLGLGYLMTIANKKQYSYEFYDEDHHSKFLPLDDVIQQFRPELYAVTFMTPQYYEAFKAIKRFKELTPQAKIIVGGPHPSALPEDTLKEIKDIDFLCKGEGEKTFEDFLDFLKNKKSLNDIDGLYYHEKGQIFSNRLRELMSKEELEEYRVDWNKILEYGPYKQKLVYTDKIERALSVITTRGCPFQCTFCDEGNIWQRKARMRTIESVIDEIKWLHRNFKTNHFNILDDTFTLNKSRVIQFCNKITPLKIKFRITAKTTTIDKEMLQNLKEAGCQVVAFGVESGDENVLRLMKKKQTIADIKHAFKLTHEVGISSYALCMVGNIGEDMNAVKKTAKLIKEIKPDFFSCSIMTPYPGSENYKICKKNGWILHYNWEHWVPSVLKIKNFKVVSRTDKMDDKDMLNAYYFINRSVLFNRFTGKYTNFFFFNFRFYINEVFPRVKTIGVKSFLLHFINVISKKA